MELEDLPVYMYHHESLQSQDILKEISKVNKIFANADLNTRIYIGKCFLMIKQIIKDEYEGCAKNVKFDVY